MSVKVPICLFLKWDFLLCRFYNGVVCSYNAVKRKHLVSWLFGLPYLFVCFLSCLCGLLYHKMTWNLKLMEWRCPSTLCPWAFDHDLLGPFIVTSTWTKSLLLFVLWFLLQRITIWNWDFFLIGSLLSIKYTELLVMFSSHASQSIRRERASEKKKKKKVLHHILDFNMLLGLIFLLVTHNFYFRLFFCLVWKCYS